MATCTWSISRELDRELIGARERQRPRRIVAPQFGVLLWRGDRNRVGEQSGAQCDLESAHLRAIVRSFGFTQSVYTDKMIVIQNVKGTLRDGIKTYKRKK